MLSRYRETIRAWSDPLGRALFRLHLRPNHLTLFGFVVSLGAASAFVGAQTRVAGVLLFVAGLCDFLDGSLARASGQVTPFGAFLDSVIDRYSDIVVLLGIVVLFARTPHARGAVVAMAGLVGSVMVSYTKARAESIGIACNVGFMERPERMICLIAGAVLDLLEPALWVLAVLSNVTALQRIAFTRRAMRDAAVPLAVVAALMLTVSPADADSAGRKVVPPERVAAWAQAVEAFQHGDPRPVIAELGAAAALDSVIGDYARLLLADALARRGDAAAARANAVAIADRYADSRLAPGALALAATLAASAGDEAGAQALLARLLASYPDSSDAPAALYRLGMTLEGRGQHESAALAYRELRILAPTSGWADGATDRLEAFGALGVRVPELSLAQRLDRAERLVRGGMPTLAADEAEGVVKEVRDPSLVERALRVVADASQRLGRYGVAARALELAAAQAPAGRKPGLKLEQGRLLARAGQRERALTLFAEVQAKGAEPEAAEASYQRARALDELDRLAEAETAYRALAGRFPNREVAGTALWRLGWLAHGKNDLRGAERNWTRVSEIPGGRGHRIAALYWAGRMREQLQNTAAAERFYRKVLAEAPRSYYGVLAARRVASPAERPAANSPERQAEPTVRLPSDPQAALGDDPGFARADLLRRIGLVDFGWLELEHVAQRAIGDPVRLYGVSSAYVREERYHLALRILRRHFGALAASGHPTVPRAFWEMLYPFGWRYEVNVAAERAGLDPFLVAAVVREESSYYPSAVSRAGARGLMQLMPATARPMAEVRGLPFRDGDLLDEPAANIQLGTSFLAGMLKEFGDPRLALAAYNAGPRRARQWWSKRRSDDVEAWVEQIPFDETRQYVKRVMLSWAEYQRIYGGSR